MKITSQTESPRPPELKSITLELTPREALVLSTLCGLLSRSEIVEKLNQESTYKKTSFLIEPIFDCPSSALGKQTVQDIDFINSIYSIIKQEFIKFMGNGD